MAFVSVACGGSSEEEDTFCTEYLSPNGKVRCGDTTMIESSRAYRLPNGQLKMFLEAKRSFRDKPDFYVELTLSEAAQEAAPQVWNYQSAEGVVSWFYERQRIADARNEYYSFRGSRGTVTISDFDGQSMTGVLKNMRYDDNLGANGLAEVPTMRFDIGCIGDPATDDASCADKCGVCSATDRCGNQVTVQLDPCP